MAGRTVFMFSGQGSQYYGMGKQLFEENKVFRHWMTRLDRLAHGLAGRHLVDAIYGGRISDVFAETALTHPAIFMVEYALAQCLIDGGIEPDLVMGASLGSFAAAAVAGQLDVEDALAAVLEQAAAFEATCEPGGMLAVLGPPALFDEYFIGSRSELAGVNFDSHFVVSARQAELHAIESGLNQRGITCQRLPVSFAFHSPAIDAARERFVNYMRCVPLRRGSLPLVCCAQGGEANAPAADYFWQVVRSPMRFRDALAHLERQGTHRYIDVGPAGTLATFVKYGLPASSASTAVALLTPYGRDGKNLAALLATAGAVRSH